MSSIWLIILLLFFCNGDFCTENGRRSCDRGRDRNSTGGAKSNNRTGCGCGNAENDNDDCGCGNPFSMLNRRDSEPDYPPFRGTNGPCGCEENNS